MGSVMIPAWAVITGGSVFFCVAVGGTIWAYWKGYRRGALLGRIAYRMGTNWPNWKWKYRGPTPPADKGVGDG